MKCLLGQRLLITFFVQLELFRIQETTKKLNKIKDKFNGIQVTNLITFITGRLNPWIIESTHGLKQARRPEFYKYIDR